MTEAADQAGDGLSGHERDAMVASMLGITPDRLRTMRRVHSKRVQVDGTGPTPPGARGRRAALWRHLDELSDDALFAAFRREEVRSRATARAGVASPVDRTGRRSVGRR